MRLRLACVSSRKTANPPLKVTVPEQFPPRLAPLHVCRILRGTSHSLDGTPPRQGHLVSPSANEPAPMDHRPSSVLAKPYSDAQQRPDHSEKGRASNRAWQFAQRPFPPRSKFARL